MVTLPLKNNIMKNTIKMLLIGVSLIANLSCAQTIMMKTVSDAKKLEINKKEFIGKPLNYFLKHINVEIKSIIPAPNKNLKEVNRIDFLFVPYIQYRNDNRDITEKPTRITVIFNQNWDLIGERCTYKNHIKIQNLPIYFLLPFVVDTNFEIGLI